MVHRPLDRAADLARQIDRLMRADLFHFWFHDRPNPHAAFFDVDCGVPEKPVTRAFVLAKIGEWYGRDAADYADKLPMLAVH